MIEIAVETQQKVITGTDLNKEVIYLLENSSKPGTVKAVLGTT